jgi:hypothetical protein
VVRSASQHKWLTACVALLGAAFSTGVPLFDGSGTPLPSGSPCRPLEPGSGLPAARRPGLSQGRERNVRALAGMGVHAALGMAIYTGRLDPDELRRLQ